MIDNKTMPVTVLRTVSVSQNGKLRVETCHIPIVFTRNRICIKFCINMYQSYLSWSQFISKYLHRVNYRDRSVCRYVSEINMSDCLIYSDVT